MKKIVINGKFLTQRITGVQRYAREICSELDKIVEPDTIEMAVPENCIDLPDYKNIKIVQVGKFKGTIWEQISLPRYAKKQKAITVNLCNASPLVNPGVVVIHDVKIKVTPQFFSKRFLLWYKLLFKRAAKKALAIITVSEFSKEEILKYYDFIKSNIYVVPNGWQHYERISYDENALAKYDLESDGYYFAMGSLEPNKNFKWIAENAKNNPKEIYAIAGSVNESVFKEGFGFDCPDNIKLLGYVSDEEAKTLMRDCRAFIFPSFYEGFGIPPLEAISAGAKQVLVSDIPVMHEIFGDNVVYINPHDAVQNLDYPKEIEDKDILDKFSWKVSAENLQMVLNSL